MAAAYKRGLQQPQIGPDLHGGGGMLMFWSHEPVAPWQDEAWLSDMRRSLRPNQYLRMIENRFVTSESQFIDMAAWDACVQASLTPSMERVPVWIGVDASTKRDSTALVAVSFDKATSCVRLVAHRVFTPTAGGPDRLRGDGGADDLGVAEALRAAASLVRPVPDAVGGAAAGEGACSN